jgi:site-specific DNA-methyltransferase (adenine-specific)
MRIDIADANNLPLLDESVDLVVTDPPYGINYISGAQGVDRKHRNATNETVVVREKFFTEIANDSLVPTEWLKDAYRVLKNGSAIYIFAHWSKWSELESAVKIHGFTVKNMIVLNKSNHGMGDLKGSYAPKHELLLFATKGKHVLRFPPRQKDVWDVPVKFSGAHRLHPNEKPLKWMVPAILASSDVGQIVLDPFCGSGSTLEAAKENGRDFIGFDIDPKWVEVTKTRLNRDEVFSDLLKA